VTTTEINQLKKILNAITLSTCFPLSNYINYTGSHTYSRDKNPVNSFLLGFLTLDGRIARLFRNIGKELPPLVA
jgi:hypothetical protein